MSDRRIAFDQITSGILVRFGDSTLHATVGSVWSYDKCVVVELTYPSGHQMKKALYAHSVIHQVLSDSGLQRLLQQIAVNL